MKFTKKNLILGLAIGAYSLFFSELGHIYITTSIVLSYIVFLFCVYLLLFKNFQLAICTVLLFILSLPFVPRNFAEFQLELIQPQSLIFTQFLIFPLSIWLFLIAAILSVKRIGLKFFLKPTWFLAYTLTLLVFIMFGTALDILFSRDTISIKYILNDLRFFVLIISGIAIGTNFFRPDQKRDSRLQLVDFLKTLTICYAFKTIIIIVIDIIQLNILFSFATSPYIFTPLFLAFLVAKNISFKNRTAGLIFCFIALFSISRGNYLLILVSILLFFVFFSGKNATKTKIKLIVLSPVFFIFIFTLALKVLPPKTASVIVYKLNFFSDELLDSNNLNRSTQVRIYELKNIYSESKNSKYPILVGQGLGGYFEFKNHPPPFEILPWDYSIDQIKSKKYFKPHTFLNYAFLKGGLLFVSFFLLSAKYFIINARKQIKLNSHLEVKFYYYYLFFFSLVIFQLFWIPELVVLWGIITPSLKKGL